VELVRSIDPRWLFQYFHFLVQEEKYRQLYEAEKAEHASTKTALNKTEADLEQSNRRIEALIRDHEKTMADFNELVCVLFAFTIHCTL
jgi:predicted transcriptional regulator